MKYRDFGEFAAACLRMAAGNLRDSVIVVHGNNKALHVVEEGTRKELPLPFPFTDRFVVGHFEIMTG